MLRSVACTHIPICPLPAYLLSGENHIYSFIVDFSSVYLLPIKENIDVSTTHEVVLLNMCAAFCMSITPQYKAVYFTMFYPSYKNK